MWQDKKNLRVSLIKLIIKRKSGVSGEMREKGSGEEGGKEKTNKI